MPLNFSLQSDNNKAAKISYIYKPWINSDFRQGRWLCVTAVTVIPRWKRRKQVVFTITKYSYFMTHPLDY